MVQPTVAVATPTYLYSATNDDCSDFVLVMSDLAPAVQGDQLAGCGEARRAPRWSTSPASTARAGATRRWTRWASSDVTEEGIAMLETVYGDATDAVQRALRRPARSTATPALLSDVAAAIGDWLRHTPDRSSVLHGDYRLDNLMFDDRPGSERPVVAVDWQTTRRRAAGSRPGVLPRDQPPARRPPPPRATRWSRRTTAPCVGHGVTDHPLDECWHDYRYGAVQGPLVTVLGAAYSQRTDRGDDMFVAMATRSCEAIRDLGTLDLI